VSTPTRRYGSPVSAAREGEALALYVRGDPESLYERDSAETFCRQALALADELGVRPLVAHCHHGLGKLYRRTGKARAGA